MEQDSLGNIHLILLYWTRPSSGLLGSLQSIRLNEELIEWSIKCRLQWESEVLCSDGP